MGGPGMTKKPEKFEPEDFKMLLLGMKWEVKFVTTEDSDLGTGKYGLCDQNKCEIKLLKTSPVVLMRRTFYHELFHAMSCFICARNKEDDGSILDEDAAECCGIGLPQVIHQLPDWLKEKV
jgi:hypothetical protein